MKHLLVLTALVLGALALALPTPAGACMNEVVFSVDDAATAVRRAETLLVRGQLRQAYRRSESALREIGSLRGHHRPLRERALLVNSLAAVRLEGHVGRSRRLNPAGIVERAVMTLRGLHAASPMDVARSAALAEALFLDEATHDEAFALLSPLESVLPNVHAHAVLARLLAGRGDTAGRNRVIRRCQARANGRERNICRANS